MIKSSKFYKSVYLNRTWCVLYESARWMYHNTIGKLIPEKTPSWYAFDKKIFTAEDRLINKDWYFIKRPLYRHEHVYYNLDNALKNNPNLKGIAFVFFMGIGDYLYTTPVLEALGKKYANIPFYAYVGESFDRNNSPIVGKLLEENPYFKKVFYFKGCRHPLIWKNYDYSDVLNKVPENFLIVPVYYDYNLKISHRVSSLFDTFNLPVPKIVPIPKMYFPQEVSPVVKEVLDQVRNLAIGKKEVVFLQLDSRGSSYTYPHMKQLVNGLTEKGYFVLSVTKGGPTDNKNYFEIDIKNFSINQTWQFLSILKKEFSMYVIAVNSVFWAASAGLELPNLGLQHWIDKKVHNLWYPNILVVTNWLYPYLPKQKQIFATPNNYTYHNYKIIDYKPVFIIDKFEQMKKTLV